MTLHEVELDELGLWKPRSGFFQHEYRKKRSRLMVQQAPAEHGARLAFCTYCQSAYLASDAVPNSACHDSPPALMYDLERLVNAGSVVEALVDALKVDSPEDLISRIEVLAGLVRDRVAGAADKPSQEPSTAADSPLPASGQDGQGTPPVASVEGPHGLAGPDTPAAHKGAAAETGAPNSTPTPARRPSQRQRKAAAAVTA